MAHPIINRETQAKIKVIAGKMSKLGFGDEDSLKDELIRRFCDIQISNLD